MSELIIVDSLNMIYKSCYAGKYTGKRSNLTTPSPGFTLQAPTGEITTGTFSFCQSLFKLCNTFKPTHLVAAGDVLATGLFRRRIYPNYKKSRRPHDNNIRRQVKRCLEIINKLAIPLVTAPTFEADDVIASLVHKFESSFDSIRVVSSDKDLHQVVTDKTTIYDPLKDIVIDKKAVIETWGVEPCMIADVQALSGDYADGFEGVPSIGLTTAVRLIKEYKTAIGVYNNRHRIVPPSRSQTKIASALETSDIETFKAVVELVKTVPITLTKEDLEFNGIQISPELKDLFKQLGFKRWAA